MRIRKGSAGTKDPAAANWDRVFGGGGAAVPLGGESPRDLRQQTCSTEPTPSHRPAELDPEDGA